MGKVDIRVKNFIKVDTVFAQLFSEGVFKGSIKIDPNKLQELDSANQTMLKDLERLRDAQKIAMLFDDKLAFQVIFGSRRTGWCTLLYASALHGTGCTVLFWAVSKDIRKGKRKEKIKKICRWSPKRNKDSADGNVGVLCWQ